MRLWVGLGNPGDKYKNTRHNLGVYAIQSFIKDYTLKDNKKLAAIVCEQNIIDDVFIIFPQTYMNKSGESIIKAVQYLNIGIQDVYVFHDEVELPPKEIRYKFGGGHKGHNGLRSIHDTFNDDKYHRIRLGVGKSQNINMMLADFLLERTNLQDTFDEVKLQKVLVDNKLI